MTENEDIEALVTAARGAMVHAHAPYSGFAVGAAVRLTDGTIIAGANFENASYGLSLCAETVALASANAAGRLHDVRAIAVVGSTSLTPCGRCRQILNEVEQVAGREIAVYCAGAEGDDISVHSVSELLPFAFGPNDLNIKADRKS